MVERQAVNLLVVGSNPTLGAFAPLTQRPEYQALTLGVTGSNPVRGIYTRLV